METQNKSNISFRYQRWQRTKQPKTTSSKPYVLLSKNLMVGISQTRKGKIQTQNCLKTFHSDIKDRQPLNCHLEILSNNILLQTICPHEQNLDWMLSTKKRLGNASFIPLRYQRWSWTKKLSWIFSNNFYQSINSHAPEGKYDLCFYYEPF